MFLQLTEAEAVELARMQAEAFAEQEGSQTVAPLAFDDDDLAALLATFGD